jgi:hypothetical protein
VACAFLLMMMIMVATMVSVLALMSRWLGERIRYLVDRDGVLRS